MDQFAALATFVRVVDAGSLSAAARSLPSSLTAVSRQLSALERHFGTQLLHRTTRRLALTDDGRMLYERGKAILGELRQVEAALSTGHHEPSGRLRIAAPTLIGRLQLAPMLPEFLRRYPAVSIDLQLVDRPVDMIEEDIHLALRVGHLPDSDLVARKLADIQMIVCASPSYLEQHGAPQTPAELAGHDCLAFSEVPGAADWRFAQDAKSKGNIAISPRLWANSLDTLVMAAKEGAGLVRVPSWQVMGEITAGNLLRVLQDFEPTPAPLHLLSQSSRLASPKTRAFADYLTAQWRNNGAFIARR
ncbi:MAG: LysR family transcriptional regulator [Bradyrhizobium sp.]|nr:LysR family transcriptional regulator [Bradyrhizobium sp.]